MVSPDEGGALSRRHIAELDGLRGIAVLVVMLHHFVRDDGPLTGPLRALHVFDRGWMGVDLFFALSGFLITGILLDTQAEAHWIRRFYARRALRILPLYYFMLLLALLLPLRTGAQAHTVWLWTYLANIPQAFPRVGLPSHVYFDFAHLWSLAIEEQFYLLWPWAVLLLNRQRLLAVVLGVLPLTLLIKAWLMHIGVSSITADYFTLVRVDGLCAGAVGALVIRTLGQVQVQRSTRVFVAAAAAICAGSSLLKPIAPYWVTLTNHLQLALLFAGLVVLTVNFAGKGGALHALRWPALLWLGRRSYGLYVWHYFLRRVFLSLFEWLQLPHGGTWTLMRLAASLALSCVAAVLSWALIESPFLRLKDRFVARDDARVAFSVSPTT